MGTMVHERVAAPSLLVSAEKAEIEQFNMLQQQFAKEFEFIFPDNMAAKAVVIIPSLTLDAEILEKVKGVHFYEERLLCLLMLLRMPHTRVIFVTSVPIDPVIVDYYLHLLPGITGYHARQRLTLLSCFDSSNKPLTQKILERPRLIRRIRQHIPTGFKAHLAFFNVTEWERKLAVQLQLPVYGCDPALLYLSSKSYGRKLFRECGIAVPAGIEDLYTREDIVEALVQLKSGQPNLTKAVLKMNEGFSGEGNAIFSYEGSPSHPTKLYSWIDSELSRRLQVVASHLPVDYFLFKFYENGGIAEAFIEGERKKSPSVQCRINPMGMVEVLSTHDQILGGESNQVFLGATFPASHEYAREIGEMGKRISSKLASLGVMGRFSIDFISVKEHNNWKHYAIEINLRKGGTTHPYLMLQFLTEGSYDTTTGMFNTLHGKPRYYFCSDNVQSDAYKGLTPYDLIEIAMCNGLLFDSSTQEGVMFHLISALSQYGKLGVVCIGATPERAQQLHTKTVEVLDKETKPGKHCCAFSCC